MGYTIERLNKEKYSDLVYLFQSAFNYNPALQEIDDKNCTQFTLISHVGYLAYSETKEPAGFYGVYPVFAKIDDKIVLISQSGDTMVHKNHQKKGLFPLLANKTYDLCIENEIRGVFGFPSDTSYSGFVKRLGWQHHENIQKFEFLIPTFPLAELSFRFSIFKKIHNTLISITKKIFKNGSFFSGSVLESNQNGVLRSEAFWEYKMKNNNIFVLNIFGADIIMKNEGKLGIGDINYKDLNHLKLVLLGIRFFCFISGFLRFTFYVSPNTKLEKDLSQIKKPSTGLPIIFKNLNSSIDLKSMKFVYFDMDTY